MKTQQLERTTASAPPAAPIPPKTHRDWIATFTVGLAAIVVCLALLQVAGWDGSVNADGVSYLDLATRFAHGQLRAVTNGYWSPLYPLILGLALRVGNALPPAYASELRVVFTVNILIFAIAALALARLVNALLRDDRGGARAPVLFRALVGGALGIWCLIRMIGTTTITPDGLLAAILFLVAAETARAIHELPSDSRALALGALLGIGYWTKAVLLPVAAIAIVAYVFAVRRQSRRRVLARVLLALVPVAAPLVLVQSISQGHPSFSETGRLNYRWYVSGVEHLPLVHESITATRARQIPSAVSMAAHPGVVLFTGTSDGTFPYWFDPSRYEAQGLGQLSFAAQARALHISTYWLRLTTGSFTLLALIALVAALTRGEPRWRRLWIAAPALGMLALYTLTHPEGRLCAAPIACVLLVLVTMTGVGEARHQSSLLSIECLSLGALTTLLLVRAARRVPTTESADVSPPAALAAELRAIGVGPGSAVGLVGDPYGQYWAHYAGVRFAAVIAPPTPETEVIDDVTLAAIAREAAARGRPIAAVLWKSPIKVTSSAVRSLVDGWHVWRPHDE